MLTDRVHLAALEVVPSYASFAKTVALCAADHVPLPTGWFSTYHMIVSGSVTSTLWEETQKANPPGETM